jgi:hypothetical protein
VRRQAVQDFFGGRQPAALRLRVDGVAVHNHIQRAQAAHAEFHLLYSRLAFEITFQAPGLLADVVSKEAALDLDFHG